MRTSSKTRFRVEWTNSAFADLADILEYIAKDSPLHARKIYRRIRARVKTLTALPGRGHVVPELLEFDVISYRELAVPPYRIIYRIDGRKVFVIAVLDGRRDLKQLLTERLLRSDASSIR